MHTHTDICSAAPLYHFNIAYVYAKSISNKSGHRDIILCESASNTLPRSRTPGNFSITLAGPDIALTPRWYRFIVICYPCVRIILCSCPILSISCRSGVWESGILRRRMRGSTWNVCFFHYNDVIMGAIASKITSLTIVYSTVYSGADQRKHKSSASLAFVREFTRDRWIPRTNGQ